MPRRGTVGIGMLGTGFIGQFHHRGLRHVAAAGPSRASGATRRAGRHSRRATAMPARTTRSRPCAPTQTVDLVIVSLPNQLHVEAVEAAARHGKGGRLHQAARAGPARRPLGRSRRCTEAGVWHGYLENVVFGAEIDAHARDGRSGGYRPAGHVPRARGAQRSARGPLLGRRDRGRRGAPRHGVARHRGRAVPVRQGRTRSARRSHGATRWSTGTGPPARTTP